ncbi:hypothetical protein GDO81_003709 [Engystomops pustulosus]|uniref:histone acetyltransferase n=3 Tax=Engystomops pustulosus TaxID=76066 RepID=A0AAV7A7N4_ENGPU|nr:hypothetical protein GDO81_003709 [Engystomops pustulosus]KAG8554189.1 hypothetical protein GDO81_003709 [Engystomops pustulosus]
MASSESMERVCRLLYERLVILFHNHKCEKCYSTEGITQYSAVPLCHGVDAILSHMKYCRAGISCQFPACPSVRVIMSHGKICRNKDCPVVINLSKDRKRKIQLHLQSEVKSFLSVESPCQNLYRQLTHQFHKHKCELCMKTPLQQYSDLPLCRSVDTVLSHMKYCRAGMSCQIPGCAASRAIISHWKVCSNKDCLLVQNLREDRKQKTLERIHQKNMLPSVMRVNRQTAKKFRQMLFVLFHTWSCMNRQKSNENSHQCDLTQCQTVQKRIKHTVSCTRGRHCQYPDCAITRLIFIHYMACIRHDCEICWPVRSVIRQLCGTEDRSTSCPSYRIWEGIPLTPATTSDEVTEPWFTAQIYRWSLTQDKPMIGPPLFQRRSLAKRVSTSRRWKKKSRLVCSCVRKHPYKRRQYSSPRLQLRTRGKDPGAVPSPL